MLTIDRFDRNQRWMIGIGVLAFVAIVVLVQILRSYPQIGQDEEVYKTVDALFTALNSRDTQRLSDCEQRLRSFRESGSLSISAAKNLDAIIKKARTGEWQTSAHKLYDLILAQRRS